MLHVVMFVVYVLFVVIPLLYVFLNVLAQETIKAFEFEFEFAITNMIFSLFHKVMLHEIQQKL